MKRTHRFETQIDMPPELANKVENITEEDSTRRPDMLRDVYRAAYLFSRSVFLTGVGASLILGAGLVAFFGLAGVDIFLIFLVFLGLDLFLAGAVYMLVLRIQMKWYKKHVIRLRIYGLAVDEEPGQREIHRSAANPNVSKPGLYRGWNEKKKRRLAQRLIADNGEWLGGDLFVRRHIRNIVESYTTNWSIVAGDFVKWGWVTKIHSEGERHPKYPWTDYGKNNIMLWRSDPPKQGANASG